MLTTAAHRGGTPRCPDYPVSTLPHSPSGPRPRPPAPPQTPPEGLRAGGIAGLKSDISRKTGIPASKSGRQGTIGRLATVPSVWPRLAVAQELSGKRCL